MNLSLSKEDFINYTTKQLNHLFPDNKVIDLKQYEKHVDTALDRVDFCFSKTTMKHYFDGTQTHLNHLHADQYLIYIWFLSNTIFKETDNLNLANKLYYLNKSLHGIDCLYNTGLPDVFLIFHGVGTMLGKAQYSDYFVSLQGCTIGSQKGAYPKMGKGVGLTAHSSIIGNCTIGNCTSISSYTSLFETNTPNNSVVFKDRETGAVKIKPAKTTYVQQFFNVNLSELK